MIRTVEGKELSVQEAYTPKSQCFGCGACVVAVNGVGAAALCTTIALCVIVYGAFYVV